MPGPPGVPAGHLPGGHLPQGHLSDEPGTDTVVVVGHAITNDNATPATTNQEICDRTGFRVLPGELVRNWDGIYTRLKSLDVKPPQLLIRSVPDQQKGSPSPESADVFVGANEVTIDDL